jgi:hypothetical protein
MALMPAGAAPQKAASTLDWARYYVARGWSAVPARLGTKFPAGEWLRYQTNLPSEAQLADWFDQQGFSRLGIVTGKHSGVIVADFDGQVGMDTLAMLDARGFPQSVRQFTPTGGCHVLLQHPGLYVPTRKWRESPWRDVLPGMDIRGDGGFIMAAPSVGAEFGSYDWDVDAHPEHCAVETAPQTFIELICQAVTSSGTGQDAPVTRAPGPLGLDLGQITDGRETYMRNTVMAVTRGLFDRLQRMPTEQEVFDEGWPQYAARVDLSRPGRGENEFRAKVRYTLARIARGSVPSFTLPGPDADPKQDEATSAGTTGTKPPPLPLVYFKDAKPNLDAADFVEGLLSSTGMSVVYGESNCGKTFFATDLALHIAIGKKWRGRDIERGGVIYCALEGSHGILNRVAAFRQHYRLDGVDIPFAVIPVTLNLLDPKADTERLIETIRHASEQMDVPVKMVVMDTLSRAMAGGNENAPDDMGALVANDARIRQAGEVHVMWIHHSGKDAAKGARGHSLLRAATDTEIEIVREHKDAPSVATVKKQRDMEIEGEWPFSLEMVELGKNRRGKPVTSCVVQDLSGEDVPAPKTKFKGHTATAYRILVDTVAEAGESGFPGAPPSVLSVPEDWWRERFYTRALPGAPQETKKRTFRRAADALIDAFAVAANNGRVWTV